jgi:hypothetical protein
VTCTETPYISQSHFTCLPGSSLPLLLVNQNLDVTAGSTKASNHVFCCAVRACSTQRLDPRHHSLIKLFKHARPGLVVTIPRFFIRKARMCEAEQRSVGARIEFDRYNCF